LRPCIHHHCTNGESKEQVHVPGTQSHLHDRDEKEGIDIVSYGNLVEKRIKYKGWIERNKAP